MALAVCAVVCAANMCLLLLLLVQRSADGLAARATQCAREPVLRKLVVAGEHYRLLTAADRREFERTAPRDCAP
jgi:hypothetical protein